MDSAASFASSDPFDKRNKNFKEKFFSYRDSVSTNRIDYKMSHGFRKQGIVANVGGRFFKISAAQMIKNPSSRLAQLSDYRSMIREDILQLCDDYEIISTEEVEFYFDRDPECFSCLLQAFRGGSVHAPSSVCLIRLQEEMEYWDVDDALLDYCCKLRLERGVNILHTYEKNMSEKLAQHYIKHKKLHLIFPIKSWNDFTSNCEKVRTRLWNLVEDPSSSIFAKIWMVISISFILLSLTTFVIGTVPGYYVIDEAGLETEIECLEKIETVCMVWFSFEYLVRFAVAPKKLTFFRQFLNIIDILTVVPFFIQLLRSDHSSDGINTWKHITQMLRIMRVIRIFRLGRHSGGLKLLCVTFKKSRSELIMLSIYLVIGIVVLAGCIYSLESRDLFPNLGEAIWFATVTITTVGFGDITPVTLPGKILTSMSFLMGLLAIAMPIHPIISNFSNCYRGQTDVDNAFKRLLRLMKLQKAEEDEKNARDETEEEELVKEEQITTTHIDAEIKTIPVASKEEMTQTYRRRTVSASVTALTNHDEEARQSFRDQRTQSLCTTKILENCVFSMSKGLRECDDDKAPENCQCIFCTDNE